MQPVEQGCTLLQLPLQAAKPLLSVRNWRADTVPAHRTAVAIAVSNVFLILLLMIHSPFFSNTSIRLIRALPVAISLKARLRPASLYKMRSSVW